jgi:hypothetical protein
MKEVGDELPLLEIGPRRIVSRGRSVKKGVVPNQPHIKMYVSLSCMSQKHLTIYMMGKRCLVRLFPTLVL